MLVTENRRLGVLDPTRKLCITYEEGRVVKVIDLEMVEEAETDDVGGGNVIGSEKTHKRKHLSAVVFGRRE